MAIIVNDATMRIIPFWNGATRGNIKIFIEKLTNDRWGPASPANHSPSTHLILEP